MFKLEFIVLLLVITSTVVIPNTFSGDCHKNKKCSSLNLENCQNNCCDNEKEKKMIGCYFTDWAWNRGGIGTYTPANIDPSLCTHINYAFASLDGETLTIKPYDPSIDIDKHYYQRVVDLIAKGLKVLISIGGWNNSAASFGWSRMFNNATARAIFVKSVVDFIKRYNFSGLDVDYEFAACPQGDRSAGSPKDAENFNQLITDLKHAFHGKYLLSVTVPAGKKTLEECFDIVKLCHIPHWINVMAYDYHSASEGVVGANAPICGTGTDFGVYDTMLYLTSVAKCPANQLVLGVPFYGHSYTLANTSKPKFGARSSGPGEVGTYSQEAGTLAYYEICQKKKEGWHTGWSKSRGSYIWKNSQFVSYDDMIDIKRKCCLINKVFGWKGVMMWAMDYDDFNNVCGHGVYPLLKTLNQQLRCLNGTTK